MRTFWVGLAVLVACNDPVADTPIELVGSWQIKQPSGFTNFRLTLTEGTTPTITGFASTTPAVCDLGGMSAMSKSGAGYDCGATLPVTGKRTADGITLILGAYPDGSFVDLALRVVGRSVVGDLTFSDASGVRHPIGPACDAGPWAVCLDSPGHLEFVH
jgi:hypothetical protein